MKKLNLPDKYYKNVLAILQLYVPNHTVWAYGSRVKNTHHEASDLDLVIRNPSNLAKKHPAIKQLREAFKESNLPIIIDVSDWASLPKTFQQEIEKEHIKIF